MIVETRATEAEAVLREQNRLVLKAAQDAMREHGIALTSLMSETEKTLVAKIAWSVVRVGAACN